MILLRKYSSKDVLNWEELFVVGEDGLKEINPATILIINYLALVGISKLTLENYVEAWLRISIVETVNGCVFSKKSDSELINRFFVTQSDVKRLIGIETEVGDKTFIQFYEEFIKERKRIVNDEESVAFIANGNKTLLEIVFAHS